MRTWGGFVYVAFVVDVFAQRIVGWHAAGDKRTDLVLTPLRIALWERDRQPPADQPQAFTEVTRSDLPPDLPFVPEGHEPPFRLLTRGAEKASADEIAENPRAASVRVRAVERVAGGVR